MSIAGELLSLIILVIASSLIDVQDRFYTTRGRYYSLQMFLLMIEAKSSSSGFLL